MAQAEGIPKIQFIKSNIRLRRMLIEIRQVLERDKEKNKELYNKDELSSNELKEIHEILCKFEEGLP